MDTFRRSHLITPICGQCATSTYIIKLFVTQCKLRYLSLQLWVAYFFTKWSMCGSKITITASKLNPGFISWSCASFIAFVSKLIPPHFSYLRKHSDWSSILITLGTIAYNITYLHLKSFFGITIGILHFLICAMTFNFYFKKLLRILPKVEEKWNSKVKAMHILTLTLIIGLSCYNFIINAAETNLDCTQFSFTLFQICVLV